VYKSNLDSSISSKFTSLLATSLAVFSKLFSVIRPDYSGMSSLIDEVLGATASIFHLCPVPVLKCIQEVRFLNSKDTAIKHDKRRIWYLTDAEVHFLWIQP